MATQVQSDGLALGRRLLLWHRHLDAVQRQIEDALTWAELTDADRGDLTDACNAVELADVTLCRISKRH